MVVKWIDIVGWNTWRYFEDLLIERDRISVLTPLKIERNASQKLLGMAHRSSDFVLLSIWFFVDRKYSEVEFIYIQSMKQSYELTELTWN